MTPISLPEVRGTISEGSEMWVLTDLGIVRSHRYIAQSEHSKEIAEFATYGAAQWWLTLINNHYEWLARRAALA